MQQLNTEALKLIKACRCRLTPQERKTLRGQVLAGDDKGALRGLIKILKRTEKGGVEYETREKSNSKANEVYAVIAFKPWQLACKPGHTFGNGANT